MQSPKVFTHIDLRIATVSSKFFLVAPILTATATAYKLSPQHDDEYLSHPCIISSLPSPMMCRPTTFSSGPAQTILYLVGCLWSSSSMANDMALN